jgi:hypothetical protein
MAILVLAVPAAYGDSIVQQFADGNVDWSRMIVTAKGIGAPPANAANIAQARAMARRAAIVVAQRNLLEIVKGVRIDSQTLVKDFMTQSDIIRSQVSGIVRGSRLIDVAYMSDSSVEATVAMPLMGEFSGVVIPLIIKQPTEPQPMAPTPPTVAPPTTPPMEPAPQVQPSTPPTAAIYTGLVLDARGLGVRPAMSPKVVDESGKEVYGSAFVSREYAVQQGVSGYAKDLSAAQNNPRVTDRPITVKGLKAEGPARCDIAISNADAEMIKASADNMSFLQKCRVMIVLD